MRVALLTYSTKPRGGVVHTLALAEALARAGTAVTVWSLGRGGDATFFRDVDPAVRLRVVPFPDRPGPPAGETETVGERVTRSIATLAAAFDPSAYDIVHAEDCISANAVDARPGRSGCIRTVHHLDQFTTPELVRCHQRAIVGPELHVCVSAAVAEELRDGWGIAATVIPNGVDAAAFARAAGPHPEARRARQAWCRRIGGPYVLTVGGIEPRKGSVDLLEAFALLAPSHPGLQLVVAGGETLFDHRHYRDRFDRRAAELGLSPLVLGPVPQADLPALVAQASAFAFPSIREGFGLAALEAAAAGVGLVVRDLPVFRQVLGGTARYGSDPPGLAAALAETLARPDPGLLAAARARAASYTWDAAARAHLDLYRRHLAGSGRP